MRKGFLMKIDSWFVKIQIHLHKIHIGSLVKMPLGWWMSFRRAGAPCRPADEALWRPLSASRRSSLAPSVGQQTKLSGGEVGALDVSVTDVEELRLHVLQLRLVVGHDSHETSQWQPPWPGQRQALPSTPSTTHGAYTKANTPSLLG